ncbi:MAG: hypothetical protein CVU56_13595 [Deltaproteobacteria bacterium HGW-Deltaproteobacteria-14]|nr:MAG: hypothetical protein CVU56_13595 [Deltaproteobacteria bacterium HGW-Deltaproteobacteria-14]
MTSRAHGTIPQELRKYGKICTYPFLHGVYMAVNAIPDLYLLVDAPNCSGFKSEQIFGTHDLNSTLLDVEGRHRIVNTGSHVANIADGNHEGFIGAYKKYAEADFVKAVAYTCFPMAAIIGTPYDLLVEDADARGVKPSIPIPGRSLAMDWDGGYMDALKCIARRIDLPDVMPDDNKVAVIGYFMDRNEEDHRANLAELERLIEDGLGLELAVTWLSGVGFDELKRVAECRTIISLPGSRAASRRLMRRVSADLVEVELPLGFEATNRFLRKIAAATGREERAERFIADSARELLPKIKWLALKRFLGSRWTYAGHPQYIPGLAELAELVGAHLVSAIAWTSCEPDVTLPETLRRPVRVSFDVDSITYSEHLVAARRDLDLIIAPAEHAPAPRWSKFLEFGFPSWGHHALFAEPFLGYRGAACLLGRIADRLEDRNYFID